MSKLYEKYKLLKENNPEQLYLFKVGVFYIFLDEDAKKVSNKLGLKCTHLNENIMKCGFPVGSLEKYLHLFATKGWKIEIIDRSIINDNMQYVKSKKIDKLLRKISKENIDKMNGIQALKYIQELKDLL